MVKKMLKNEGKRTFHVCLMITDIEGLTKMKRKRKEKGPKGPRKERKDNIAVQREMCLNLVTRVYGFTRVYAGLRRFTGLRGFTGLLA